MVWADRRISVCGVGDWDVGTVSGWSRNSDVRAWRINRGGRCRTGQHANPFGGWRVSDSLLLCVDWFVPFFFTLCLCSLRDFANTNVPFVNLYLSFLDL